ncbi:hypothetical protein DM01DRAFT_1113837 [Hesseltinella vesiculosa]|uniref:snRNA-activating protein complex subunit 3 n=1 Tax=Hesseltinella vesiculosa TaxID=101127 RepID=A0A1X2GA32_9FUNG|nr:hypothetical protein DM01DRAFT_1113837 [Hesseltinella vesiculosa]
MKGADFESEWQQLFAAQKKEEDTLDMQQVESNAKAQELTASRNLDEISELFVDPTLFSLLRQFNDTRVVKRQQIRRTRAYNGDPFVRNKPQAKDVQPMRVLDEQDEDYWKQLQSQHDPENTSYYVNPKVPKKRRYFAEHGPTVATPSNDEAQRSTFNLLDQPPSATPADNIPETRIYRKFSQMVNELEQSPLRTLRSRLLSDTLPRHRIQGNYAMPSQTPQTPHPLPDSPILIYNIAIFQAHTPSRRMQEFQFTGDQTLQDLRDSLFCRTDFVSYGDRLDRERDGLLLNTPKAKKSASYFYINDQFYRDEREPGQKQYSQLDKLRTWVRDNMSSSDAQQQQPTLPMSSIKLRDLDLVIDQPFLFSHQHFCQHLMVVRSIRLMGAYDERDCDKYPLVVYNWRFTRYKCTMCTIYPAEYITTNDYLSGFSPCYFCKQCFQPFHFNEQGDAVSTFDVSDYHGT